MKLKNFIKKNETTGEPATKKFRSKKKLLAGLAAGAALACGILAAGKFGSEKADDGFDVPDDTDEDEDEDEG